MADNTNNDIDVNWTDASLGSVPLSMIQFCLMKDAANRNAGPAAAAVTVHTSTGGYKYRAARLASIDAGMNLRLEDIVVSRVKRPSHKVQKQQQLLQNSGGASGDSGGGVDLDRIVVSHGGGSSSSAAATAAAATKTTQHSNQQVPASEDTMSVAKSAFLPGRSVSMIELPPHWGALFDAQALAVRKEFFRRYRAGRRLLKERKTEQRAAAQERRKAKKAKKVTKEAMLTAAEKRVKAAKAGKKKGSAV